MKAISSDIQLVILAGGRGERLAPLTDSIPKPLMVFHGKTFLEHQIEYYFARGFTKILVLTGYKSFLFLTLKDILENRLKGLQMEIIQQSESFSTAQRVQSARSLLAENICLIYGDTLVRLNPEEEASHFTEIVGNKIKFVAFEGSGYGSQKNIQFEGNRVSYLKENSPTNTHLNLGVFYGASKSFLNCIKPDLDLEEALFTNVNLECTSTIQKYYSLTDTSRLAPLERYLDPNRYVVFLDRDGTLNEKAERARYLMNPLEFKWKKNVRQIFSLFLFRKLEFYVITNQPGVGKGVLQKSQADAINSHLFEYTLRSRNRLKGIFVCYHDWDDGCSCRKPKSGLIYRAQEIFDINFDSALYVGDDDRDYSASVNAGIQFKRVTPHGGNLILIVTGWLLRKKLT
jgi:histidinol-phosphate phosphatase family protein